MKIISKYKDFYDYLCIDNDPDLTYVRKEKVCFNIIDDLISHDYDHKIGKGIDLHLVNDPVGLINICGFTFGVYPNVYTSPALYVKLKDGAYHIKMLSISEVEKLCMLKSEHEQKSYIIAICKEYFKNDSNAPNTYSTCGYYWRGSILKDIMRYTWKQENSEVFLKLGSPVFVIYSCFIVNAAYETLNEVKLDSGHKDRINIVHGINLTRFPTAWTDICFNKLGIDVTKYWYDDLISLNTYSDIESFLMTSKLDPEPKISNEGKIIAHGFDLKTSFRKM